jgi:dTDP-4-dehydrorhamnose 3,5-epimerase-like enzyme
MKQPLLISLQTKGNTDEGFLHIVHPAALTFQMQRVFYTMDTPAGITRGRHAHHQTEMVLIAVKGNIEVRTVMITGEENIYRLHDPSTGLYIPNLCWHEMNYSDGAIQLVICNTPYSESDYIRDWNQFKDMQQQYGTR